MSKRYLFFLRHYNDIDNIAPAIYYFLKKSEENRADVIIYSGNYDYTRDVNLLFIKDIFPQQFSYNWIGNYFGLNFESFVNTQKPTLNKRIKAMFINTLRKYYISFNNVTNFALTPFIRILKGAKRAINININDIVTGYEKTQPVVNTRIKEILEEHSWPSLVIFDVNRTPPTIGLLNALRFNGIHRIICLPVSPLISYNTLRSEYLVNVKSSQFLEMHDYSGFDAIGYVDNYFVESYNRTHRLLGVESTLKNKTRALGSIRYCHDWLAIKERFIEPFDYETDKIKVVFFPSDPFSNVNKEEVERTFELLSLFENYEVIIKHHTRSKQVNRFFSRSKEYKNITFIDDIESSALINWADVIIFWSSSVAVEGYIKNKTMVCLSYIVGNRNLYETFDAGFVARCRDDLHEFLELYKEDKSKIKYNYSGIQNLLRDVIVPGNDRVIDNYLDFMQEFETPVDVY